MLTSGWLQGTDAGTSDCSWQEVRVLTLSPGSLSAGCVGSEKGENLFLFLNLD